MDIQKIDQDVDQYKGTLFIRIKVVLVGDAGVGKTHLMNTYVREQPPKNNLPTIGIEFASKTVTLQDGGMVRVQIWDTAGQERYRGITNTHFKGAGGAIVAYDITKDRTFESLHKWIEDLKEQAQDDIVIFVVGNKADLVDRNPSSRKVTIESGKQLAKQFNAFFEETSALRGTNVACCFDRLIQEMYVQKNKYGDIRSDLYKLDPDTKQIGCNCKCFS